MAFASSEQVLIRIAVFGVVMSVMATGMISLLLSDAASDYSFDEIQSYREDLSSFTGESMLNSTPWVLSAAYTPWTSEDIPLIDHTDKDGWLFGKKLTAEDMGSYGQYLNKAADIKLDPKQKSSVPITVSDDTREFVDDTNVKWWADTSTWYGWITRPIGEFFGLETGERNVTAHIWNFNGIRYVFDPCLPFKYTDTSEEVPASNISVRDGALSLVWYSYAAANGTQEGLSGGLDVYGGRVLLASYAATDIIAAYNTSSGYATTYDFDFEGTHLQLSIRFDQKVIDAGTPLMAAWTAGDWSLAITSISAGNFYDIENSNGFTATAGNMIDTFIKIYTLQLPSINNPWMDLILWLLVGLPMTLGMLFITLRVIDTVKPKIGL